MSGRTSAVVDELSATLAALADPTRRHMVQMLGKGPKAVGELAGAFALSAPAISKHLRVLRHSQLVIEERHTRDARLRIYRLRRERLEDLDAWLAHMRAFWELQLGAFAAHVVERAIADRSAVKGIVKGGKRPQQKRGNARLKPDGRGSRTRARKD